MARRASVLDHVIAYMISRNMLRRGAHCRIELSLPRADVTNAGLFRFTAYFVMQFQVYMHHIYFA